MYSSFEPSKIANKKFGQNFLKDESVLKKIIQSMPNNLPIVEIGPGLGDLTKELIQKNRVRAFEVDNRLCEYLQNKFKESIKNRRFELICKDILKHKGSLLDEDYSLVANLPYYIATTIILDALRDSRCKNILVMVQKEVAQKFSARVGSKEYGSLAILSQSVAEVEILFDVAPSSFVPPPKVTSSILKITKQDSLNDKGFEEFLKIATKQPRKTLLKNLSSKFDKKRVEDILNSYNLSKTIRPHELELTLYHHLYNELIKDIEDERRESTITRGSKRGE